MHWLKAVYCVVPKHGDLQKIIRDGSKLQRWNPWGDPREYQEKRELYYKVTNWTRGNNYKGNWTEPAYMVRPCSENGRRKITQNNIEVDAETKESTRKTEENLDGRYKEGHERKKPKWRPMRRMEAMESRCRTT